MKLGTIRSGLALLLSLALCFCLCPPAFAAIAAEDAQPKAEQLTALGLFRGVDEAGTPDLDRAPTRTEALVMLIRLLGREAEALAYDGPCPFGDVADWAAPYVAWAYAQGLTRGVSADTFGGEGAATLNMYLTFVLRALGFQEGAEGDFTWDAPQKLAYWWLPSIPYAAVQEPFLRADAAVISHAALSARVKLTRHTLADALMEGGMFSPETFQTAYDGAAYARPSYEAAAESLRTIQGSTDGALTLLAELPGHGAIYEAVPYGLPHHVNDIYLVFNADSYVGEGKLLELELPLASAWLSSLPANIVLSEDGLTLTYEAQGYAWSEIVQGAPGGPVLKDYRYTLDLTTGQTRVTSQIAENPKPS